MRNAMDVSLQFQTLRFISIWPLVLFDTSPHAEKEPFGFPDFRLISSGT
jgi:hypothetical protein